MTREIKFRAWDKHSGQMLEIVNVRDGFREMKKGQITTSQLFDELNSSGYVPMQYTGLKDKNGKPIYEGDIVEFSDKWEWYRGEYGIKMIFADPEKKKELQEKYDAEKMERRKVEIPSCYQEFSESDLQSYWEIIGNIYENPELLSNPKG